MNENVLDFDRRSFAFRYQYYDKSIDKEVKKGFALPELSKKVTNEALFELVHAIANLVDIPEDSIVNGELTERTNFFIQ